MVISLANFLLLCAFYLVCPVNQRNIFNTFLKSFPSNLVTNPSYIWLLITGWILFCASLGLTLFGWTGFIPISVTVVGTVGVTIGCIVLFSILIVFSVSLEIINNITRDIMKNKLNIQDLEFAIKKYNEIVLKMKSFLFCSYSSQVCMMIGNLYNIAMYFSGCIPYEQVHIYGPL